MNAGLMFTSLILYYFQVLLIPLVYGFAIVPKDVLIGLNVITSLSTAIYCLKCRPQFKNNMLILVFYGMALPIYGAVAVSWPSSWNWLFILLSFFPNLYIRDRLDKALRYKLYYHYLQNLTIFLASLLVMQWIAFGWISLHSYDFTGAYEVYIASIYWVITTLTTIGYGDITPSTTPGRMYAMLIMLFGAGFYSLLIAKISSILVTINQKKAASTDKLKNFLRLCETYHIDPKEKHDLLQYYEFHLDQEWRRSEEELLEALPNAISDKIVDYINADLVSHLDIFANVDLQIRLEVVRKMETRLYSPGDIICHEGEEGRELYFIRHGQVKIYRDSEKESNTIAVLNKGECFGELSLLREEKRNASIQAVIYSEIYLLTRTAFKELSLEYPILWENIERLATRRSF